MSRPDSPGADARISDFMAKPHFEIVRERAQGRSLSATDKSLFILIMSLRVGILTEADIPERVSGRHLVALFEEGNLSSLYHSRALSYAGALHVSRSKALSQILLSVPDFIAVEALSSIQLTRNHILLLYRSLLSRDKANDGKAFASYLNRFLRARKAPARRRRLNRKRKVVNK